MQKGMNIKYAFMNIYFIINNFITLHFFCIVLRMNEEHQAGQNVANRILLMFTAIRLGVNCK